MTTTKRASDGADGIPTELMKPEGPSLKYTDLVMLLSKNKNSLWLGGVVVRTLDLRLKRSRVRIWAVLLSGNNRRRTWSVLVSNEILYDLSVWDT